MRGCRARGGGGGWRANVNNIYMKCEVINNANFGNDPAFNPEIPYQSLSNEVCN